MISAKLYGALRARDGGWSQPGVGRSRTGKTSQGSNNGVGDGRYAPQREAVSEPLAEKQNPGLFRRRRAACLEHGAGGGGTLRQHSTGQGKAGIRTEPAAPEGRF